MSDNTAHSTMPSRRNCSWGLRPLPLCHGLQRGAPNVQSSCHTVCETPSSSSNSTSCSARVHDKGTGEAASTVGGAAEVELANNHHLDPRVLGLKVLTAFAAAAHAGAHVHVHVAGHAYVCMGRCTCTGTGTRATGRGGAGDDTHIDFCLDTLTHLRSAQTTSIHPSSSMHSLHHLRSAVRLAAVRTTSTSTSSTSTSTTSNIIRRIRVVNVQRRNPSCARRCFASNAAVAAVKSKKGVVPLNPAADVRRGRIPPPPPPGRPPISLPGLPIIASGVVFVGLICYRLFFYSPSKPEEAAVAAVVDADFEAESEDVKAASPFSGTKHTHTHTTRRLSC